MHRESVCLDELTMVTVLNGCSKLGHYVFGVHGHAFLIKTGLNLFVKACNAIMDVYVKCGLIDETRRVFDELKERSVVSWTILLDGAVRLEGLEIAKLVFDQMPERNKVAWTIMIAGYIENGFTMEAFKLLRTVLFDLRFELNFVTLCSWLSASAQSGNLLMGQWMHAYYLKKINSDHDIMISTSLVDMYAKCGRVNDALRVFAMTTPRNVVTWNAMLSGLAMEGMGDVLVNMFDQMVREVKPDRVTFTAVLSACSHSGLVDLDLLGRAGYLDEAKSVIEQMHIPPNEVVLGSLLGACSVHKNVEMGECLMKDLVDLYPHNTQYHVLLSNMYIVAGKRDQAISLRRILKHRGIRKVPGISSIYIGGQIHQFSAGDKSHRQIHEIYLMLDEMIQRLKLAGYVPDVACHLLFGEECVDEWEEKEQALFSHSEKLALSFGLMSTRAGMPLYIFKNLRICLDCHSAMKVASKVYDRKIVIRDLCGSVGTSLDRNPRLYNFYSLLDPSKLNLGGESHGQPVPFNIGTLILQRVWWPRLSLETVVEDELKFGMDWVFQCHTLSPSRSSNPIGPQAHSAQTRFLGPAYPSGICLNTKGHGFLFYNIFLP
ncbi:hypothetical protein DM860_005582 [Cuscuta australis]|uniref:DYW domain-containing protein n=1 Tax=Cuscuta australis TaxID=267555 RepID=A0A328DUE5_9ASTE|nr:hypothetical protein DM860_005582 [Cuscuta australis]